MHEKEFILVVWCELKIPSVRITVRHHEACELKILSLGITVPHDSASIIDVMSISYPTIPNCLTEVLCFLSFLILFRSFQAELNK